jgi:hypothetical protein
MSDLGGSLVSRWRLSNRRLTSTHAHIHHFFFGDFGVQRSKKKSPVKESSELSCFSACVFLPGVPQCRQESSKREMDLDRFSSYFRNSITPLAGRLQGGKREFIAGGVCSGEKKPLVYHIPLKAIVFFSSSNV